METNKLGLKILSLIIAIFLWIFVIGEVNPEITRTYYLDIEFTNEDAMTRKGLSVIDYEDTLVSVKVTGKKSDLDEFKQSQLRALIDLSLVSEGEVLVPVTVVPINPLNNLSITSHEPKEIKMNIDRSISVEKPVEIILQGKTPQDYMPGEIEYEHDIVVVSGPKTMIEKIDKLAVFVDLENKTESFSSNLPIRILDKSGDDIKSLHSSMEYLDITVPIHKIKTVKINPRLNTANDNERDNVRINPEKIEIYGENISSIESIDTEYININRLKESGSIKIKLILPQGVNIADENTEIIAIYSSKDLSDKEFKIPADNIIARNLNSDLDYRVNSPREFIVKVSGIQKDLNGLQIKDFNIAVDLQNLNIGEYNLPITVEVPLGIILDSIEPRNIEIILE